MMRKRKYLLLHEKRKISHKSRSQDDNEPDPAMQAFSFKSKLMIGLLLYAGVISALYWKDGINSIQISQTNKEGTPQSKPNLSSEIPSGTNVISTSDKNDSTSSESSQNSEKPEDIRKQNKKTESPQTKNKKNVDFVSGFQFHVQDFLKMAPIVSNNGLSSKTWQEVTPVKHVNHSSVRVFVMDQFITERECDGLMRAHENHVMLHNQYEPIVCFSDVLTMTKYLRQAGVRWSDVVSDKDFLQGTRCLNMSLSSQLKGKLTWSYSTSFYPGESSYSHQYENHVNRYTGLDPRNGGKFQVTSYKKGVGYKLHTDCSENGELRDRFATVLVYLQDVEEGGETEFTELGISITPRKGRALAWNNMDAKGNCDPTSLHKANPVLKGKKYILQRWYYYHNFEMLGKRSAPPSQPPRDELTPRVACDEFNSGSCRWYDEWNYDHLTR